MTVFCPSCGKPNMDSATQCVACGTALKPKTAGSKFKGTMMMTGVAPPTKPGGADSPSAGIPAAPPPAVPAPQKPNMAFQATMLGPVTPPVGGAPPPSDGFGAPAAGGFGAPAASEGFGTPSASGFGAPAPRDGFGAPAASEGFGAPPAGGFGAPPAASGFGTPPASGFGAPPAAGGFGTPSASGFGAPPAGGAPATPPSGGGGGKGKYIAIGCVALLALCCVSGIIVQAVLPTVMQSAAGAAGGAAATGAVTLSTGFMPDPQTATGHAGGPTPGSTFGTECRGFVPTVPSHVLVTSTPFVNLRVLVNAASDTTLIIQRSDGTVVCTDDDEGVNPVVQGPFPAGAHNVYVGTYSAAAAGSPYVIGFSELPTTSSSSLPIPPI